MQYQLETESLADATIRRSLVDDTHELAVAAGNASLTIEQTTVRGTMPQQRTGLFGDGIAGVRLQTALSDAPVTVLIDRCAVEGSPRAGVASFGASVAIGGTLLECNSIALDGEEYFDRPFDFTDLGGNVCGCGHVTEICQVLTTNLEPPDFE